MTKILTLNEAYWQTWHHRIIPYDYQEFETPELQKLIEELKEADMKGWNIIYKIRDMYLDQPISG